MFPFLYLTLELPKRIINDAIGAATGQVDVFGVTFSQVGLLALLCAAFLTSVLVHGLLKMRINTMKGILSERMLRRLRYTLISRMLRFPKPYFRRTSQGELVAMITGETEPMGGLMGDALTQPVLQAGQMITILVFLFLQSLWFGLAAIALIPLQAWLIPKLQRQINLMNKERIKEVRRLAALIGESAQGASDLRIHGGWRYRLSMISARLGVVFGIRLKIYKKKFFMKFINNFITQLTPFFFFSVGGYLVIQGAVSLGALVAALAAYKDLSSPWKELLAYYNQSQDMSLRWETVVEKFSPGNVIDARLMDGAPAEVPSLAGTVELQDITVTDSDGNPVLENISAQFGKGSVVAVDAPSEEDRQALADVLTREVMPSSGQVVIAGHALAGLHQSVIASRIGHADTRPMLFQGTFGDNTMMPLKQNPQGDVTPEVQAAAQEAAAAGNSADPVEAEWLDPALAGVQDRAEVQAWWLSLLDTMGTGGALYRRSLDQKIDLETRPDLARRLIAARPKVWEAVVAADLARHVHRFDPALYNPALPVIGNLFFATMRRPVTQQELATQTDLFDLMRNLGLEAGLLELSRDVIELLNQIFGTDGTEHPLFRKLGLDPAVFERSVQLLTSRTGTLSDADKAMLMTVPLRISAEQIGPAFSNEMRETILGLRAANGLQFREGLNDLYAPLDAGEIAPGLSVLENALFGKISDSAGARADDLRKLVSEVLEREGLKPEVMALMYDFALASGGSNLPAVFTEPLAISRAIIKQPDVLILDQVLSGYDPKIWREVNARLRALLPQTTMIYLGDGFDNPDQFDAFLEIRQGRMVSADKAAEDADDSAASADLLRKVRALESTTLFSGMGRKQLRLLAFGAKWFSAQAGDVIFNKDDDPRDGAYMILSGAAELFDPGDGQEEKHIAMVGPGTLVGELGLIRNVPRALTMRAETDVEALRLGADEFLAVVENDAATSFKLLQVVAGYTA
ncbi:ABC transporter transmembrane domain-containing protein [Roseobacter insulae]|uniref:ABC transporter transmembrane domain-containing protein n=1 Tax=Roseobacter insulae TaxID=2859783 RepID=UPI0027E3E7DE|nr:ABC transporter transmembrane domain-containing protein [Roseobacter insulae]